MSVMSKVDKWRKVPPWRNLYEFESLRGDWVVSSHRLSFKNIHLQLETSEDRLTIWLLIGDPQNPEAHPFLAQRKNGAWYFTDKLDTKHGLV
jgi:hypothetical protein